MRIAVLGGGLAGLACGYYLGRAGHKATVIGASDSHGALSLKFKSRGHEFPSLSHLLLSTDSALCGLLAELDLSDRLIWRRVRSAVAIEGKLRSLDSISDLLRLGSRSPVERLRRSLSWKLAAERPRYAMHLDQVPAPRWVRDHLGASGYERVIGPLLRARYGEYAEETPAYLLRARMQQDRATKRGMLRGGFGLLGARLARSIESAGGRVLLGQPAQRVDCERGGATVEVGGVASDFDAVVSTLSLPAFAKVAADGLLRHLPFAGMPHQGLVCVAVVSRRRVTPIYETFIADDGAPFWSVQNTGIFEETPEAGEVMYLKRSCPEHSESYRTSDETLTRQALDTLEALYPSFSRGDVLDTQVTRRPEVEPFWTLGARKRRPPYCLDETRVFLCTGAHAYPRRPGADSSVILARETAQRVLQS